VRKNSFEFLSLRESFLSLTLTFFGGKKRKKRDDIFLLFLVECNREIFTCTKVCAEYDTHTEREFEREFERDRE
jgi:hypothetical protein